MMLAHKLGTDLAPDGVELDTQGSVADARHARFEQFALRGAAMLTELCLGGSLGALRSFMVKPEAPAREGHQRTYKVVACLKIEGIDRWWTMADQFTDPALVANMAEGALQAHAAAHPEDKDWVAQCRQRLARWCGSRTAPLLIYNHASTHRTAAVSPKSRLL